MTHVIDQNSTVIFSYSNINMYVGEMFGKYRDIYPFFLGKKKLLRHLPFLSWRKKDIFLKLQQNDCRSIKEYWPLKNHRGLRTGLTILFSTTFIPPSPSILVDPRVFLFSLFLLILLQWSISIYTFFAQNYQK